MASRESFYCLIVPFWLQKATMKLEMENTIHGKWYDDACGGAFGLELLGERWALLIVRELMFGGRRFKELREGLPTISAKAMTERLHGLERSGVIQRVLLPIAASRKSPAPEPVQLYELTPWGYRADEVLLALCRWALASPGHDHSLFLSPAAMMMSLRALFDPARACGLNLAGAIRMDDESFVASVADRQLSIARGTTDNPVFTIAASGADPVKRLIHGKAPPEVLGPLGLSISGDREAAARFIGMFGFPAKWATEPMIP
jgi:DNA-binding HxlR family transcriptional regulator